MADNEKDFFARWSRLKREHAAQPDATPRPVPVEPSPELPPIDQLTPESDFKDFMHAKVEDAVRRAALKKLFADPRFNVMDALDVYIDDYTKGEAVSPEMLANLEHSKTTLFGRQQEPDATDQEEHRDAPQLVDNAPQPEEIKADVPAEEPGQAAEPAPAAQCVTEDGRKEDGATG